MTTPPNDPGGRESVPLLLVPKGPGAALEPVAERRSRTSALPPPRPSIRVASTRTGKAIGLLRSRLGAAGSLAAMMLVLCAIFADMLASDLPIVCKVHGSFFLFPNITRPADLVEMGGAEVRASSAWKIDALVAHSAVAEASVPLQAPGTKGHPFGTDRFGRDVFARVVHGTRSYLVFAFGAVLASLVLGGFLGSAAGLFGGVADAFIGRLIETVSAFPPLVLVLGIQAAVPHATLGTLFLAIALTRWPEVARLVRAEVMLVATRDYVMAARALGASPFRVLRKHVAPNVRGQLVVLGAIGVPAVILIEASLDFLRVGAPPGAASWGETLSEFRDATSAWWLLLFPGLCLFATVIAMNLVGEARRDSLDPRARY